MREAKVERKTNETEISVELNIDGFGNYCIGSPVGFFSHMLETFAKTGLFDIEMKINGDLEVDQHHTIEDSGIALGTAFRKALGELKGINRAGFFAYPMDEALAVVAVDIGGRPYVQFDAGFSRRFCGLFDTDVLEDFFWGFARGLGANIVVKMPFGRSDHHKIEAIFKAFGKAMQTATKINNGVGGKIPSTKGIIEG